MERVIGVRPSPELRCVGLPYRHQACLSQSSYQGMVFPRSEVGEDWASVGGTEVSGLEKVLVRGHQSPKGRTRQSGRVVVEALGHDPSGFPVADGDRVDHRFGGLGPFLAGREEFPAGKLFRVEKVELLDGWEIGQLHPEDLTAPGP